ncbi:nuclear transport factor 2 family protein [Streptomyces adelaidensis]|uniref:nuclear transport factor 2 family protein n=1 Tax=Streptomyces adelaidensis TaxID=2796465 RepID=UPI00190423C6|nr:nuclear transport factor 2 family protein [Streptomyces adelaidensis]
MTTFTDREVAALTERLNRLETAERARELTAHYALCLDRKDFEALAGLFTEDAVLHAGPDTCTGHAAVMAFFHSAIEVVDPSVKKHLMANPRVTHTAPDEVRVDSYFLYTAIGEASVLGWGSYADVVRIGEDGMARFSEKRITVDVAADVREGWAKP